MITESMALVVIKDPTSLAVILHTALIPLPQNLDHGVSSESLYSYFSKWNDENYKKDKFLMPHRDIKSISLMSLT